MSAIGIVAIDEDGFLLAELRPARAAMLAHGAALVMVYHDALANPRHLLADLGADRRDDPARLVAADDRVRVDRQAADRLASRFGPAVLVQIAAAHARGLHLDNDLAGARGRVRKLHQLDLAPAREDYAAHRFLRLSSRLKNQPTLFPDGMVPSNEPIEPRFDLTGLASTHLTKLYRLKTSGARFQVSMEVSGTSGIPD